MTSREQFEAWLIREYPWAIDALNMAFFQGDEETGYYTGGDFTYDGSSCSEALFWAWRGWQASREAVEVELPQEANCRFKYPEAVAHCDGFNDALEQCTDAILTAGIKIKGD